MSKRITIHSSRDSERLYDEVMVVTTRDRGYQHKERVGYADAETGIIVSDVAKFEEWIRGRADGVN